jgi:hypothetical protein
MQMFRFFFFYFFFIFCVPNMLFHTCFPLPTTVTPQESPVPVKAVERTPVVGIPVASVIAPQPTKLVESDPIKKVESKPITKAESKPTMVDTPVVEKPAKKTIPVQTRPKTDNHLTFDDLFVRVNPNDLTPSQRKVKKQKPNPSRRTKSKSSNVKNRKVRNSI